MRALLHELDKSSVNLSKSLSEDIRGHLEATGKIAYNELFYEFESLNGGINFALLKEEELKTIIDTPVANLKLSERLNRKQGVVPKFRENIKHDITRLFLHGEGYPVIAARIAEWGHSSFKRALNITRTEAGRVQAITRQKSQKEAHKLGIEFKKMWVATLDGRTRHNHQILDGEKVEPDEYFEINGHKALQPHMFGIASEDVNCRCRTISRLAEDDSPLLRQDNATGEVSEWKNYREWSALKTVENSINKVYNQGMNSSGAVYGAWNDKNDPYNKERERHAELYYNSVRNRDKNQEIARVAKNSGFSQSDIERIYNHVFIKKHHLAGGYKRFDPNYDMAESWRRLSETGGNNIQKHDLVMLNHELLEQKLMSQGLSYDEAHTETNKKYNYQAAWISWAMKKGDL